jgi:hypothetical protein
MCATGQTSTVGERNVAVLSHTPKGKTMNRFTCAVCLTLTIGIGGCGAAESVATKLTAEEAECSDLAGNARTICHAEINGRANVAEAQRVVNETPSPAHRYALLLARADAEFAVAKARCDDQSGTPKAVCLAEAEREHAFAEADAAMAEKIADARLTARQTSAKAETKADDTATAARGAAADAKRDASYAVAQERCEVFAGDAKAECLEEAEAYYAQH